MLRAGIDIGGTFTDGVIVDTTKGTVHREKVLTTVDNPVRGLVEVLAKLGLSSDDPDRLVHGTTLVTNLLLERTGCRVGLLTTRGFRDVIEIQRSYRRDLLDLNWIKPAPVVPRHLRLEIQERVRADGTVERKPDRVEVLHRLQELIAARVDAIAVCLFNSYVNPSNEQLVAQWISELCPDLPVSLSSAVDPQIREYERFSTTCINAYARPAVQSYIGQLERDVRSDVLFMHSGGGVLPPSAVAERPVRLVMSGPAGGVIATQKLGLEVGQPNVITFDMGGTSTDVCVIRSGNPHHAEEIEVTWGIPLRAESIEIESIGAGGGSIASRDAGGALQVGPRSAGAVPGPAAYGRGGTEPTVTDANVVIGLLHPDRFLGGQMCLDHAKATDTVGRLAADFGVSAQDMAIGIHQVVNANMAQLIRELTVNKGIDPRDFALISFGGAGGQHAYGVAEISGCREVLFPRHASAFSALGLVMADIQASEVRSYLVPLDSLDPALLEQVLGDVERRALDDLLLADGTRTSVRNQALVRYIGQTHEVMIDLQPADGASDLYDRFQYKHESLFGTRLNDPAEIVSLHVTVAVPPDGTAGIASRKEDTGPHNLTPTDVRWVALFGGTEAPVYDVAALWPGDRVSGPALVEDTDTMIVVPPGGQLRAEAAGLLRLQLYNEGSQR